MINEFNDAAKALVDVGVELMDGKTQDQVKDQTIKSKTTRAKSSASALASKNLDDYAVPCQVYCWGELIEALKKCRAAGAFGRR